MSTVIGIFNDQSDAENAVDEIRDAGITDEKISILAKEGMISEEDEESFLDQDLTTGIGSGGALGGLVGLLVGAGTLAIPGVGPILAVGPIAAGLTGVATGGLAGGLVDLGIPKDRGEFYENEVKKGGILAAVEADKSKIEEVASFMRNNGAQDVETH